MKRNVLLIHTHDSGNYFSAYGYDVPTPNVQKFADDGIVFEQAFCTSPTCSPSRCSLMSGQYPHTNGMIGLANRGFQMQNYEQHMASIFANHDYETVLCGIQHEFGHYGKAQEAMTKLGYQKNLTAPYESNHQQFMDWDEANTNNLIHWLKEDHEKAFFASMGFFSTHRQYPASSIEYPIPEYLIENEITKKDWAGHCASLAQFDERFGRIIETLKEANLYDSTTIVFTSDHGIPFPLAKCTLFDQGIHVACIIRSPLSNAKAYHYPHVFSQIDILPTLCDWHQLPLLHEVQGISYANAIANHTSERKEIFSQINFHTSYEPCRCIRSDTYKYIRYYDESYPHPNISNIDESISKQFYLDTKIIQINKDMEALYDLKKDPFEKHNLIKDDTMKDVLRELRQHLYDWQKDTKDFLYDHSLIWNKEWIVNRPESSDPKNIEDKYLIVIK